MNINMRQNINKITAYFLIFIFLFFFFTNCYADDIDPDTNKTEILEASSLNSNELNLNSHSCIVLDRLSKNIIYGKNENNKVKMASTTKIMTAIIVLENCSLDKTVEASKKAAGTGGSRLGLKTGDKITIRDLIYGLMLCSGNDAAVCLAESVSGSIPEFANLMNAKAQELGLSNTHFESPHGLDSDEHYTTAYELAILSDYALKNTTFLNIVSTKNYTITINSYPKNLSNTNELLGTLNGVYGIKTGFTNGANRCLVTACKRDNMDIICVVLGADTKKFRTQDSIKLIEYTFENFEYLNIKDVATSSVFNWRHDNPDFFLVEKGNSNTIEISIDSSINETPIIPVKKELVDDIKTYVSLESYFKAPVIKGDFIGTLKISSKGTIIKEFNLLSDNTIEKNNIFDYVLNFFKFYPYQLEKIICK